MGLQVRFPCHLLGAGLPSVISVGSCYVLIAGRLEIEQVLGLDKAVD